MNICMVGVGYVGLVTGTCLAESGNEVNCVDIDGQKISMLNKGKIPIFEPGLEALIERNVKEKRPTFTTDLSRAGKVIGRFKRNLPSSLMEEMFILPAS